MLYLHQTKLVLSIRCISLGFFSWYGFVHVAGLLVLHVKWGECWYMYLILVPVYVTITALGVPSCMYVSAAALHRTKQSVWWMVPYEEGTIGFWSRHDTDRGLPTFLRSCSSAAWPSTRGSCDTPANCHFLGPKPLYHADAIVLINDCQIGEMNSYCRFWLIVATSMLIYFSRNEKSTWTELIHCTICWVVSCLSLPGDLIK